MRRRQLFICPCGAMDTGLRRYDDVFFFVILVFFLPPVWGMGDKGSFLARTE